MAKTYEQAEAVEQIANGLIPNYKPDLVEARIMYVFVDKAGTKNGREIWGKAKKVPAFWDWYAEKDFLIEVALDKWNELDANQRTALVAHLLEHCIGEADEETADMKWKIRDPEVQEFTSVLQRYGVWHSGLVDFVSAAQALNLDQIVREEAEIEDLGDQVQSSNE